MEFSKLTALAMPDKNVRDDILQTNRWYFSLPHTKGLSLSRLGQIIEQSINEIYVFDAETLNFIFVNEGARNNLGYSLDELSKLTPIDIKPEFTSLKFNELIKPLRSGGDKAVIFETVHKRKDDSVYPVEVHLQFSGDEEPAIFVAIILDITNRNARVEELKMARNQALEASQTKSDFLAVMSHELRTPLNAVIGFSEIIHRQMMGPPGEGKYREYARLIKESGEHLLSLVNNVLDLSAIEAGKMNVSKENIDVKRLFADCLMFVSQHAEDKSIEISEKMSTALPDLYADQKMLRQILINLLSNAVKHTPKNGQVIFSTETSKEEIRFVIHDNGPGIPQDMLNLVLEPFAQATSSPYTKDKSWGLGLSIVKNLTELHDGTLIIESDPGDGAKITVILPLGRGG